MQTLVISESESLSVVAGGSYDLRVSIHGSDRNISGALTPRAVWTKVPGTDAVTVLAAPSPGWQYLLKEVMIHNPSGGSATVVLKVTRGNDVYTLFEGSIASKKTYRLSDNAAV